MISIFVLFPLLSVALMRIVTVLPADIVPLYLLTLSVNGSPKLSVTEASNKSPYVFREMNSATNHKKRIIPIRINGVNPCRTIEFYIGANNWIEYTDL